LVDSGVVYVATENDTVYALSAQDGAVTWSIHLATPAPLSDLPCGDIDPLGITSTPVIDDSLGEIFVVAEQLAGSQVQHWLYGLDLATGAVKLERQVDPVSPVPMDPRPQQQRAALAIDGGYVLVGFGGLAGDCSDSNGNPYHGWVVAASETSASLPLVAYAVGVSELGSASAATQGAIWGPGGPSVDASGDVYVATGNGGTGDTGDPNRSGFDYGDSVIELSPPSQGLQDISYFAPANWQADNQSDSDLGSTNPILVPNPPGPDLVFAVGKESTAYLLQAGSLGGITSNAVQANGCFARGAGAYLAPYVYLPCDGTAMVALKVTTGSKPSLSAAWTQPDGINGSPIVAGGRLWVLDRRNGTLYGLDPSTGAVVATLGLVNSSSPNFSSAAAGDGILVAASGTSGTLQVQAWAFPGSPSGAYTPVKPVRICDTRTGQGIPANQCNSGGSGTLGPQKTRTIRVTGEGQPAVPADATAAILNVTVTDTTASSFLTVWPSTVARPTASDLNWSAGETRPNLIEVPLGNGSVDLFNEQGGADLVVDLEGYVAPPASPGAGLFDPLVPARICDTRVGPGTGANQCNHEGASPGTLGPAASMSVNTQGEGGVPSSGVAAVVLNVTVTDTTSSGYLTAWPANSARPLASNLNWSSGETVANRVTVPVSDPGGQVSIFNAAGRANVVLDVAGWYTDSSNSKAAGYLYTPVNPNRICDTRSSPPNPCSGKTLEAPGTTGIAVAGRSGIPPEAKAAVLNLTAVDTNSASYLTVWPDSAARPLASDLNWSAGEVVANLAVVQLGASDGAIDAFNAVGSTDLVVDAEGYFS
jgi:outer membrane protein assembly factor BamB